MVSCQSEFCSSYSSHLQGAPAHRFAHSSPKPLLFNVFQSGKCFVSERLCTYSFNKQWKGNFRAPRQQNQWYNILFSSLSDAVPDNFSIPPTSLPSFVLKVGLCKYHTILDSKLDQTDEASPLARGVLTLCFSLFYLGQRLRELLVKSNYNLSR